jgi:hypothetical protein
VGGHQEDAVSPVQGSTVVLKTLHPNLPGSVRLSPPAIPTDFKQQLPQLLEDTAGQVPSLFGP